MRATIDSGGRVVVPKAVRDRLRLKAGTQVEIIERDGWIEIAPAATPMDLVRVDGRLVTRTSEQMPPLSAEVVSDTIAATRR